MHETKAARRIRWKLASASVGVVLVLMWALVVLGQNTPQRGKSQGSSPRLPGAVTKRPPGSSLTLRSTSPSFSRRCRATRMPRRCTLTPSSSSAASSKFVFRRVLSARRSQAAKDRSKQYFELTKLVGGQSVELDAAAVDALIKQHDTGYRKLADAQRRPQCVFETGFGIAAMLPHAQASRQVARISSLKVQRAVQRGDLAAAIREIDVVLRLVRDLRPRGAS